MRKLYGWQFFETLAKNNARVGRSTQDTVTLLSGGECLVGPTWAPGAYRDVDKGNPIAISQPGDGVVVMVFPSAIPPGAPSQCGEVVHGIDAEPGVFEADRGGRQRAEPLGRGATAGRTTA
jgi:spermidine/putrescine-binding protein